jgi:hypothetical protein
MWNIKLLLLESIFFAYLGAATNVRGIIDHKDLFHSENLWKWEIISGANWFHFDFLPDYKQTIHMIWDKEASDQVDVALWWEQYSTVPDNDASCIFSSCGW